MLTNALKKTLAAAMVVALLGRDLGAAHLSQFSRAAVMAPPSIRSAPPPAAAATAQTARISNSAAVWKIAAAARKALARLRDLLDPPVLPPPSEVQRAASGPAHLETPWEAPWKASVDRMRLLNPEGVVATHDPYAGAQAPQGADELIADHASAPTPAQPRQRLLRMPSLGGLTLALGGSDSFARMRLVGQAASTSASWTPGAAFAVSAGTAGRGGDARRSLQAACNAGVARCASGANGFTADFGGTKLTLVSYDASRAPGQRNQMVMETADGRRVEFASSPLVFDLDGDGVRTSDSRERFDIDGNGRYETLHDVSAGDGVLVFDADGDGVSGDGGRELFGDNTDLNGDGRADGFKDGFEALRALVRRAVADRVLPSEVPAAHRLGAAELATLEKAYGLKMRVGGLNRAAVSLARAGIVSIRLPSGGLSRVENFDGRGSTLLQQAGAIFSRRDGSSGSYADVWFQARPKEFRRLAAAY